MPPAFGIEMGSNPDTRQQKKAAFWRPFFVGPSDRIRTCGILLPKQARYQLRYTRITDVLYRMF